MLLAACAGSAAPATTAATSTTTTAPATNTTAPATTITAPATTITVPVPPFDPYGASILEMQQAMDEGRLTAADLVDFYLARIAAYDDAGPLLNAFITVNPEARDEAARLDAERAQRGPRSLLHGIPVVLKDNINTLDMPTTAGSAVLAGFVPSDDAFQAARLRAAGAIILGKVNMQEFARSIHTNSSVIGRTLSPYVIDRNVGGSSGGTGVAVTADLATVGLGSDTCGSIRIPSAFNSLFGLRPTVGLSSRSGVIPLSTSEDTVGPLARTVADLAIVLDATVGSDPADPVTAGAATHQPDSYLDFVDPNGLVGARIGVMDSLFGAPGPVSNATRAALAQMEAAGATLVHVEIPGRSAILGNATSVFLREWAFATEAYFSAYPDAPIASLDDVLAAGDYLPETGSLLRRAVAIATLDTAEYAAAVAARAQAAAAITAVLDEHELDALAYPSIQVASARNGVNQEGNNCGTAAVSGLPALSVPAGLESTGMPVGIDLLGRAFAEPTLIRIASGYEAAVDPRVEPPLTPPLNR